MTSRTPDTLAARPDRPAWQRLAVLVVILAVVAAAGAGVWYLFLRPAAPAAVGLSALPSAFPTVAGEASGSPAASIAEPAASAATGGTGTSGDLAGTWSVDTSIGSFDDFSSSFVGYRVKEELAGVGAAEAVGRTPDVTGTLTFEGTAVTAVEISADLTTLRSDNSMRDGQLGRQGLETDTFPTATFVLTEPIELGALPVEGETFDATAAGELTLHGETKQVELTLEARLVDGVVSVVGSLPIFFGDYGIPTPESMRVLSIDENGTMEFQLHFTKA
jgi:polyisoprenoid-binding protein YceI